MQFRTRSGRVLGYIIAIIGCITVEIASAQNVREPLGLGDALPLMYLGKAIHFDVETVHSGDLRGKALIIDFWATWCTPCIKVFPILDTIQQSLKDKLTVLAVTSQDRKPVETFLKRLQASRKIRLLPTIVNDTIIERLFQHRVIPHYVWINKEGVVEAITSEKEITMEKVGRWVNGLKPELSTKIDSLHFDSGRPIFASRQYNIGDSLVYHSVISKFKQGLPDNGSYSGPNYISLPNHSVVRLYQLALGGFNLELLDYKRVIIDSAVNKEDSFKLGLFSRSDKYLWKSRRSEFCYSYELVVPDSTYNRPELFAMMQQDLNRYFASQGISGHLSKRRTIVLALRRTDTTINIAAKGGKPIDEYTEFSIHIANLPLSFFVSKFQVYMNTDQSIPIRDQTGFRKMVDISINCNLRDINQVNDTLKRYGLRFVETEEDIDMVVLHYSRVVGKPTTF